MAVRWKLRELLEAKGTNPYALARAMGNVELAPKLYRLASVSRPLRRVDLSTIEGIVLTLRRMTGEHITANDLIEITEGDNDDVFP